MYNYQEEKSRLYTDEGIKMLLKAKDHVQKLLKVSGAARCGEIIQGLGGGDTFMMLACIDKLVEEGEILEVKQVKRVRGQNQIYVSNKEY